MTPIVINKGKIIFFQLQNYMYDFFEPIEESIDDDNTNKKKDYK